MRVSGGNDVKFRLSSSFPRAELNLSMTYCILSCLLRNLVVICR